MTLRIGIVAGEASGDILGARLMAALRSRGERPPRFVGVGGSAMLAEGLDALAPLDALAINGFAEPLRQAPRLLRLLRRLREAFLAERLDAMVGVDFNVFNLLLERAVKKRGIPTAHYVSPSVYFWRRGRIRRIGRAADVVLALFPFEPALYREHGARAVFVGHPLADEIAPDDGSAAARARCRARLGIPAQRVAIALLPGSRQSEIHHLGDLFLATAARLRGALAQPVFLVPTPRPSIHEAVAARARRHPELDCRLLPGGSREAIAAADAVLAKSGTATLEALLLRRPMVVAYRIGALAHAIVWSLRTADRVALPNILAGREAVPELLQRDATPERLAAALLAQYQRGREDGEYAAFCAHWHRQLRRGGAGRAADAVLSLIRRQPGR